MIQLNSIPIPAAGLCVRELGETVIIINEDGDELHSLDETGGFIWHAITGSSTVKDIIDSLCREYDVTEARAENDIRKFLTLLIDKNLISI